MLPNFIVIGASRSGTQWTHDNLELHPDIYLPTERQELHFFSKYYDEGMERYEQFFDDHKQEKAVGEVTPDYIFSVEAANRIKKHLPNVKLIVSLRNPTERLYSVYWTLKGKYKENEELSFEEKLEQNPELIEQGFYYNHLKPYIDIFGKENILVLRFDQIKNDSSSFLKSIYQFLGIDKDFVSPYRNKKINRATFRKFTGRSPVLYFVWRGLKKFKMNTLAYKVEKWNSISIPTMDPETKKKLIEVYKPMNEKLSQLLNEDFSYWNK